MKKRASIFRIIEFFIFFALIIMIFSKLTWLFRGNKEESREDIVAFRNQGEIDVVLYGGSTVSRFYMPLEAWHEKGYTSYNYASDASRADLLKSFLQESRKHNKALLHICDIRGLTLIDESNVREESVRNWSDSVNVFTPTRIKGITTFLSLRDTKEWDFLSLYFDLFKYHTNYEALKNEKQWSYLNLDNIVNMDKGFIYRKGQIPFSEPSKVDTFKDLSDSERTVLYELLDYCRQEDLNVLFICCPYVISDQEFSVMNTAGEIIKSYGYDFINFNLLYKDLGLNFETDFLDVNHVNYLGAEKYTDYLMNYISDNYDLPDHRGNINYIQWDEDYNVFKNLQEQWNSDTNTLVNEHIYARDIGLTLPMINDFYEWYQLIQNNNFTILLEKDNKLDWKITDDNILKAFSTWGIDMSQQYYIGIWNGDTRIYASNTENAYQGQLGIDGGRGTVSCDIHFDKEPQILLNTIDYRVNGEGIHIVIFDNNYRQVVDSITLVNTENGIGIKR